MSVFLLPTEPSQHTWGIIWTWLILGPSDVAARACRGKWTVWYTVWPLAVVSGTWTGTVCWRVGNWTTCGIAAGLTVTFWPVDSSCVNIHKSLAIINIKVHAFLYYLLAWANKIKQTYEEKLVILYVLTSIIALDEILSCLRRSTHEMDFAKW